MELEKAKELLSKATRYELRDHAFGDREISWQIDGVDVGSGYIGGSSADVTVLEDPVGLAHISEGWFTFSGDGARALAGCGTLGRIERNDEAGPDEYQDGNTMPGLTLEGVRKELTEE